MHQPSWESFGNCGSYIKHFVKAYSQNLTSGCHSIKQCLAQCTQKTLQTLLCLIVFIHKKFHSNPLKIIQVINPFATGTGVDPVQSLWRFQNLVWNGLSFQKLQHLMWMDKWKDGWTDNGLTDGICDWISVPKTLFRQHKKSTWFDYLSNIKSLKLKYV